jgi:hypothetical protein
MCGSRLSGDGRVIVTTPGAALERGNLVVAEATAREVGRIFAGEPLDQKSK